MVGATQSNPPTTVVQVLNYGISGQSFDYVYGVPPSNSFGNLTQDALARVDIVLNRDGQKYLVIFAGTNGIFLKGNSGNTEATLNLAYLDARLAAGWPAGHICNGTMLPRQNQHESDRTTYNTTIRTGSTSRGVKICDFAANATIGCAGCENNTTYFGDTVHPLAAGHVIMGQIVKDALFP